MNSSSSFGIVLRIAYLLSQNAWPRLSISTLPVRFFSACNFISPTPWLRTLIAGLLWHSLNDGTYEGCCAPPGSGVKQICPVPWTPLELLPSSQFYNMNKSLRNSSIPMQMRCSSLNGHSPQTQGTPKDADVETWHEAKKSCPWSMEKYERALNCGLSSCFKTVQL